MVSELILCSSYWFAVNVDMEWKCPSLEQQGPQAVVELDSHKMQAQTFQGATLSYVKQQKRVCFQIYAASEHMGSVWVSDKCILE